MGEMIKDEKRLQLLEEEMNEIKEHIRKALGHLYVLGLSPYAGYYEKLLKIKKILK